MSKGKWANKGKHQDQYGSSGLEDSSFEKLEVLLDLFDRSREVDTKEVVSFFQKGFGVQLLQAWAYYSQNHKDKTYTSCTIRLTRLLRIIGGYEELIEFGVTLIKEILTSYIGILYNALTAKRGDLTNPTLRLITCIISFGNGALLDDFVALFDFNLPKLKELLRPTKQELANVEWTKQDQHLSMRYCFIQMLLSILEYSAPLLRKDFITKNPKIIFNWIRYICVIDSDDLINETLTVWDEKILKEQSFKKVTKLEFFNVWNMPKLLPVYYSAQSTETRAKFNTFILSLCTDFKYGLKFPVDEHWLLDEPKNGAIHVNHRNFRSRNRFLYCVITHLRPLDEELQMCTLVEILRSTPELIPPYVNFLASRGAHDPKLTSYWIAQTLLLSKIIRLDTTNEIVDLTGTAAPSKAVISELIVPSVLNRAVLTKCLQSEHYLIRQLSIQLIVDSLQRLEQILQVYEKKKLVEAKAELVGFVYHRLPELSIIASTLTGCHAEKADNKILQVALSMALNLYVSLFNDSFNVSQAISKPYLEVINKKSFEGLDLVLLDNYFQLQEGDTSRLKWWNKSEDSSSLFVSLLKIAASNDSMSGKIIGLLSNLVNQTVVFNYDSVKADPVIALVHSLKIVITEDDLESANISKIWKLLDESIARCVRTPFKYLDQSMTLERISPLILTIFEQWKFVEKSNYEAISKWLVLFLRFSIIFGEPIAAINKLIKDVELAFDYENYIFEDTFEKAVPSLKNDQQLQQTAQGSFLEFITSSSLDLIEKFNGIPVTDYEIVAALARVLSIINDDSITLKKSESVLSKIFSLVGNYWYTHPDATAKFSKQKYWKDLFLGSSSEKAIYVSGILSEIFSQLDNFDPKDFSCVVKTLVQEKNSEENLAIIGDSLWVLEQEDLLPVASHESELLQRSALTLLLRRKIPISEELFVDLQKPSLLPLLTLFITSNLVEFTNLGNHLEKISEVEGTLSVFNALASNSKHSKDLITFALARDDPILKTLIASSLADQPHQHSQVEQFIKLMSEAKPVALGLISTKDFTVIPFHQLLNIFTNDTVALSEKEKSLVLNYSLTEATNKYTPEISNLVMSLAIFNTETVKIWINKCILYFTKVFAETTESTPDLVKFIGTFKLLLLKIDIAKIINKSNINALLEVIITKWSRDEFALGFASVIVLCGSNKFIDCNKILQILVNNEENALAKSTAVTAKSRFYTAFIVERLFSFDVTKNSNVSLQEKLLTFYNGSTRPDDLLLFNVLEKIETKLNSSWIDNVYSWEFLDLLNENEEDLIGETKLIEKKKEGYVITLNKRFVTNGLKSYNVQRPKLTQFSKNNKDNWDSVEEFYTNVSVNVNEATSEITYDPLFLSLLVINNDELIEVSSNEESGLVVKANIKKLIESDLFSSLIINLASEDDSVLSVTKTILGSLLCSLKEKTNTFKDKRLFELFVSKLLYTFKDNYVAENYTPLIFIMITRLVPILNNPGHILYEKAFRWVLKNPFVKPHEIPLFLEITTISAASEETGVYYKQVTWLIESLIEAVKTKRDVRLLRNKNVFEWILNLQNSPYTNQRIRYKIIEFIATMQRVEDGADVLITRYAGLTNLKQTSSGLQENKTITNEVKEAQNAQELLNIDQIALKYTIAGSSKKRLRDWTNDDIVTYNKRLSVTQ